MSLKGVRGGPELVVAPATTAIINPIKTTHGSKQPRLFLNK
ncbi:MAG: hypothetical protein AABX80_02320 [Nanoarchaeota archaeon]